CSCFAGARWGSYFLRAAPSHALRFLRFWWCLRHSLSALASFCFRVSLCFLQPVILIFVFCLIRPPFCPVISVGIRSFSPHRLNFFFSGTLAVSAEWVPAGSVVSKRVNGASGVDSKRE